MYSPKAHRCSAWLSELTMNTIAATLTAQLSSDTSNATLLVVESTAVGGSLVVMTGTYCVLDIGLAAREVDGGQALARAAHLHHGAHALAIH